MSFALLPPSSTTAGKSAQTGKTKSIIRPRFDPELQATVDAFVAAFPEKLDIELIRKTAPEPDAAPILDKYPELVHTEYNIPGLEDGDPHVVISVFQPKAAKSSRLPGCYFMHGGGQIMQDRFAQLDHMISYFDGAEAVFASIEYRLAPEHPAPAGLHDCYAGLLWLFENATRLGIDGNKIIIGGGSGGAPLTASSAILCRDNGKAMPCGIILMTPMIDDRLATISAQQFDTDTVWDTRAIREAWRFVLGEKLGGPDVDPITAPARMEDLAGLPPTYVDAGSCEAFRDDAVAFASKLWKCGVSAELHIWPGGFHGFDVLCTEAAVSRDSIAVKSRWIKRILAAVDAKEKTQT